LLMVYPPTSAAAASDCLLMVYPPTSAAVTVGFKSLGVEGGGCQSPVNPQSYFLNPK